MSDMNKEMNNPCPGCGRHCDLSVPSCPRGETYARGEEPSVNGKEAGHHGRHDGHDHYEGNGERHPHEGREWTGKRGYGRQEGREGRHEDGQHKELPQSLNEEAYAAMDTDGKLCTLLHELHRMNRFGTESRGGQGRILKILAQEGDMTQRALTERLGIQPGSVSEVIGKLERAGFITRSENAEDRRTADVHLTEAGREQLDARQQDKPALFSSLTEEEQTQLLSLLEKLRSDWLERFPRERRGRESRVLSRNHHRH